MDDHNILRLPPARKQRVGTITAEITILRDGKPSDDLSAAERVLASYAICEQAAALLAEGKNVSTGHRIAARAHVISLVQRDGDDLTRHFIGQLAGMLDATCWKDPA